MSEHESTPKIQVDSDWKAQAQAEKERLAAAEQTNPPPGQDGADAGERGLPEASFKTLVGTLASQAIMGLGVMQDPETKGVMIDLEGSRFAIDLLGVIEEKTRGNLDEAEAKEITQVLAELRSRFVQISQLLAQQAAAGTLRTQPASGVSGGPIIPDA